MTLNSILLLQTDESNLLDNISPDYESVAAFIEDNFDLFVEKYNEESEMENSWEAVGIEHKEKISVLLIDGETEGLFLDFSKDDGYAILGDDFVMFDFKTEGESPIKNIEADEFCYSVIGGYLYLKDGEYFSTTEENNSTEDYWQDQTQGQSTYDGQEKGKVGCGKIENPDAYVKDKYGKGWYVEKKKSLPMKGYSQSKLSVYRHNKEKSVASEGNCWVVSAYIVLQYYADNKYSDMPSSSEMITYYPKKSEPKIYKKFYDEKGKNTSKKIKKDNGNVVYEWEMKNTEYNFEKLWAKTREYTNKKYGKINSGTIWQTENIIKNVADAYDCTIKTNVSTLWGATYMNVIKSVDKGDAFVWSTSNDTYGSHTMAGCGYKLYAKKTKVWFVTVKDYKLFYELRDGHSEDPRYYDVSGHVGFSGIIFLEGK